MSLDAEQLTVLGIGAASLLVIGPAIFKAANMRGDTNEKWRARVDLAVVALDERIVVELGQLRDETDKVLPPDDAPFDPAQAIVDPSQLSERVERTAKYYAARVRMSSDLKRCQQLGRLFVVSLLVLAIGIILLTLQFSELVTGSAIKWAGLVLGGGGLVALVVAGGVYIACVDRLSGDEILADPGGSWREGTS